MNRTAIIGATRTRTGWLFIAADGAVARSASFLGPLEPFGHVPRPDPSAVVPPWPATCGRLAIGVADPHTSLWTSDGTGPIAPAPGAPPGVVQSAAFTDADHGMIVLDGGELFVTHDGAASFERVDLGEAAAAEVACVQGGLQVTTSGGVIAFDQEARRTERPTPQASAPSDPELRAPVLAAVLRRYGALVAHEFGAVVADDGRVLVPRDHALVPIAATSDAELAALIDSRTCSAARWADHYALLCEDSIVRVDGRTLRGERVAPAWISAKGAMPVSDGVHLMGTCLGSKETCVLAGARLFRIPNPTSESIDGAPVGYRRLDVLGSTGDEVVVVSEDPAGWQLLRRDPWTGHSRRPLPMSLPPGTASFDRTSLALTPDGTTMIGVACPRTFTDCDDRGRRLVQLALSDGSITTVPLPDGATRAGFTSATRGVAVGRDISKLWLTYDRGAHWQARDAGVGGAIRMPDDVVHSSTGGVRCDPRRCVIDGRIVVEFGPRRAAIDRVLASPAELPEVPRWSSSQSRLEPVAVGDPRPVVDVERGDAFHLDDTGRTHYLRDSVHATLHVTAAGRWEVSWRGFDWQGEYGARRASGMLALPRSAEAKYHLLRATREGIAMLYDGMRAVVLWIPAGGRPVEIVDELLTRSPDGYPDVEDMLTLPDGTLALLFASYRLHETARYHRLLRVGRDGHAIAQRTLYWDDDWRRPGDKNAGIAIIDGVLGVQWAPRDPGFPRYFFAIDATMPRRPSLAADVEFASPLCRPGQQEALTVVVNSWFEGERHVFLRGRSKLCLQSIELGRNSFGHEQFATASRHGDLRTTIHAGLTRGYRWHQVTRQR